MTWPPKTDEEKRAAHRRQLEAAPYLAHIETFAPAPPPPEPVTDADKAKLRAERDKALAFIETFHPGWRRTRR